MHLGKLKRSAILLFGKNPQRFFHQAHIKIGRFLSETEIFATDIIDGNLFKQVEQALTILKSKYLISLSLMRVFTAVKNWNYRFMR